VRGCHFGPTITPSLFGELRRVVGTGVGIFRQVVRLHAEAIDNPDIPWRNQGYRGRAPNSATQISRPRRRSSDSGPPPRIRIARQISSR